MRSAWLALAGGDRIAVKASGFPGGRSRRPVVDMIETHLLQFERARVGKWLILFVWGWPLGESVVPRRWHNLLDILR